MSKAMFGFATALALTMSTAWAEDEKADEKVATETVASTESATESKSVSASESATGSGVEAGRDRGTMKESSEVRASFDARWLREREGYRDGGY